MRSAGGPSLVVVLAAMGCGSSGAVTTGRDASSDLDATYWDGGASPTGDGGLPGLLDAGPDAQSSPPDAGSSDDAAAPLPLPSGGLTIDLSRVSVSGISSGAFMAVQFGVAFSSLVKGIGVFAGGPLGCSQGSLAIAEVNCADGIGAPDASALAAATVAMADAGKIDDTSNLAGARVFVFGGALDVVVSPSVVDATNAYFAAFVPASSIDYVSRRPNTGHTMPTLDYGGLCSSSVAPWIGDCAYDGAGAALGQIYGTLAPASPSPSGTIASLAQDAYLANPASHSLGDTAYVYIPASCAAGEPCGVHVAFHGCEMNASGAEGDGFYRHAGYNAWADTNHLVVLYPQTIATLANPEACWDFWGYDSPDYDTRLAPQMAMVRQMIAGLSGVDAG